MCAHYLVPEFGLLIGTAQIMQKRQVINDIQINVMYVMQTMQLNKLFKSGRASLKSLKRNEVIEVRKVKSNSIG